MVGRLRKDGQPDMRFNCNRESATGGGTFYLSSNYGSDFNPPGPLRKDGHPNMCYAANRKYVDEYNAKMQAKILVTTAARAHSPLPLRKDGQPDMRHKCNRENASSVVQNSDLTTQRFYSSNNYESDLNPPGPLRKDGQPNMRYAANKEWVARHNVTVPKRAANPSLSRKDEEIEKKLNPPGPLRDDGQPDMRYSVNKKWVAEQGMDKKVEANKNQETENILVNLKFRLVNAYSLLSKLDELDKEIAKCNLDIVAVTETWFKDDSDLKEACPEGFKGVHQPREGRRGGGVAIFYRDDIKMTEHSQVNYKSFEYLDVSLAFGPGKEIRVINIYRPPGNCEIDFLKEFPTLLLASVKGKSRPIITGDFNLHVENPNNNVRDFIKLIKSHDFVQHVKDPTHKKGGTLDLIISRPSDSLVQNVRVSNDYFSDHKTVKCTLAIEKEEIIEREE